MGKSTAVAERPETALSTEVDYSAYEASGLEQIQADDLVLPRVRILQSNSKALKKSRQEYIEGAEAGQILLTIPETLFDEFMFVPCTIEHVFTEWVPFDEGGGFRGVHKFDDPKVVQAVEEHGSKFGEIPTGNGETVYTEQYQVYGIAVDPETLVELGRFSMAVKSTMMPAFRKWLTQVTGYKIRTKGGRSVTPPLFAHIVRMRTREDSNDKGDFFVPIMEPAFEKKVVSSLLIPGHELFEAGHEMQQLIGKGAAKADYADGEVVAEGETSDDGIPF